MKRVITYVLAFTALISVYLASGVRDTSDWQDARPFFIVWAITTAVALLINNINYVRRVTYPIVVCVSSWAYKHKILKTKFTRNTYKVYKMQGMSYRKLFNYVQNLFDIYIEGLENI